MHARGIWKLSVDRPTDRQVALDHLARRVASSALVGALADALRSHKRPDFGQMAVILFGGSNGDQRAGLLGQIIKSVGPALLSSVAGGALGQMLQGSAGAGGGVPGATQISASDLSQLTPDQVRELATSAASGPWRA